MTAPKKPQDRKPKAEKIQRPEDVAGFDLLRPIDEVPVWDQAPLLALVAELTGDSDEEGKVELDNAESIRILGKIGQAMLPFSVDAKAFTKFCTGKDALERVAQLAVAWTATLGEGESSDDS